ncbi:MAG: ComEC/Rec2 family competence protein [Solirubrobacterales bacterium]
MKIKTLSLIMLLVLLLTGCNSPPASNTITDNPDILKVDYIDVGQGDSILIQLNGKNMLIDAGTNESQGKLLAYLKNQNIRKLDYVIATHPHEDHIGGMAEVIKSFEIGAFYAPKKVANTKTFEDMVNALKSKNLKIDTAKEGVVINFGSNANCLMLAPNSENYEDVNNYSAVIKLTYKNTSFLFTGDAQKLSEKEMLDKGLDLSCDVLKVGHHGSSTSSSAAFLDKASPKVAVISCGKNNDYGHPHKQTVTTLKKRNIKIYRTDVDGTVLIESDGKNIVKK